eukprot:2893635-Alexandrium_andersonii.AAC.1
MRQPAHGEVGHLAAQPMLALERGLANDLAELQAQLVQDCLRVQRQAALAARAVNACLISPQTNATRRKRLLEHSEHIQRADPGLSKSGSESLMTGM